MEWPMEDIIDMTEEDKYTTDNGEGFKVDSDSEAEWCLEKLAEQKTEYDRLKALGEMKLRNWNDMLTRLSDVYEQNAKRLKDRLIGYYISLPDNVKNETKTQRKYKLFSGAIIEKFSHPKYKTDDKILGGWLNSNNYSQFIEMKLIPKWGEFKKKTQLNKDGIVITNDGEIVEGVIATMTETEYEIEVK